VTRRSGRRPGDSGTREAIRSAASRQFAELGYDRTSMRSVAREAGVDPALVAHFFGTKHQLFVDVVELPFDPDQVLPVLFAGQPEEIGRRFADFLLTTLENPEARRRLTGLVRAAASEPDAARMVRELITREVFARVVDALGVNDAHLRATLLGSQVVGLIMARYVIGIEPLASLPPDAVAAAIAPNLQRYLTGPLGASARQEPE
jgi:AcrR family transcriptional regulator